MSMKETIQSATEITNWTRQLRAELENLRQQVKEKRIEIEDSVAQLEGLFADENRPLLASTEDETEVGEQEDSE